MVYIKSVNKKNCFFHFKKKSRRPKPPGPMGHIAQRDDTKTAKLLLYVKKYHTLTFNELFSKETSSVDNSQYINLVRFNVINDAVWSFD